MPPGTSDRRLASRRTRDPGSDAVSAQTAGRPVRGGFFPMGRSGFCPFDGAARNCPASWLVLKVARHASQPRRASAASDRSTSDRLKFDLPRVAQRARSSTACHTVVLERAARDPRVNIYIGRQPPRRATHAEQLLKDQPRPADAGNWERDLAGVHVQQSCHTVRCPQSLHCFRDHRDCQPQAAFCSFTSDAAASAARTSQRPSASPRSADTRTGHRTTRSRTAASHDRGASHHSGSDCGRPGD